MANTVPSSRIEAGSGTGGVVPGTPSTNSGFVPNEKTTFEIVLLLVTPEMLMSNIAVSNKNGLCGPFQAIEPSPGLWYMFPGPGPPIISPSGCPLIGDN
jgi:hypothetical protein